MALPYVSDRSELAMAIQLHYVLLFCSVSTISTLDTDPTHSLMRREE